MVLPIKFSVHSATRQHPAAYRKIWSNADYLWKKKIHAFVHTATVQQMYDSFLYCRSKVKTSNVRRGRVDSCLICLLVGCKRSSRCLVCAHRYSTYDAIFSPPFLPSSLADFLPLTADTDDHSHLLFSSTPSPSATS